MPVTVNDNAVANRPIHVVMVTSGGSGYPITGGDSSGALDGSTFYTRVRGDGSSTAIVRLKVTGGVSKNLVMVTLQLVCKLSVLVIHLLVSTCLVLTFTQTVVQPT